MTKNEMVENITRVLNENIDTRDEILERIINLDSDMTEDDYRGLIECNTVIREDFKIIAEMGYEIKKRPDGFYFLEESK